MRASSRRLPTPTALRAGSFANDTSLVGWVPKGFKAVQLCKIYVPMEYFRKGFPDMDASRSFWQLPGQQCRKAVLQKGEDR